METLWTDYPVLMAVGAMCIIVGCTFYVDQYNWEWVNFIPGHRGRMMKKARRDYVLGKASDGFTSLIMDWLMAEELTQEEASELYRLLKQAYPNKSLFPSEVLLKEAINKRLLAGVHAPVELPKEKTKRKSLFEKLPA